MSQQQVEFIIGGCIEPFFGTIGAVVTVDRGDDLPQRHLLGDAWIPAEADTEGYQFGAAEASVWVEEPAFSSAAGFPFPTGSSFTPTITAAMIW